MDLSIKIESMSPEERGGNLAQKGSFGVFGSALWYLRKRLMSLMGNATEGIAPFDE